MHLNPNVTLSGKYILGEVLYGSSESYAYLAKAPTMGEEFVITEFFPQSIVERDENGYIKMPPNMNKTFEQKLSKFTRDADRLAHIKANRILGVREVLEQLGTAYVVSRVLKGDTMETKLARDSANKYSLSDRIIDVIYDGVKSAASEGIMLQFQPDSVYVDEVGFITFMLNYSQEFNEAEMVADTAKLIYFMTTGLKYEEDYQPDLLANDNRYGQALRKVLEGGVPIKTFAELDEYIVKKAPRGAESLRKNAGSFALFIILLVILAAATAYGTYLLSGLLLDGKLPGLWPFAAEAEPAAVSLFHFQERF